jgi:hypothetical protein
MAQLFYQKKHLLVPKSSFLIPTFRFASETETYFNTKTIGWQRLTLIYHEEMYYLMSFSSLYV